MKFFLADNQKIQFGKDDVYKAGELFVRTTSFQARWRPVDKNGESFSKNLHAKFNSIVPDKTLPLQVGCPAPYTSTKNVAFIPCDSYLDQLYITAQREGFNVDAVLTIHKFGFTHTKSNGDYRTVQVITPKTRIASSSQNKPFALGWEGLCLSNVGGMGHWHQKHYNFDGELEITITLTPIECRCLSSIKLKALTEVNDKILADRIGSDLSIIPVSGKPVPCHRAFVIAHSPAFDRLVKGTFGDSKSNFLKMPELSEVSAQALIEYVYLGDTARPEDNFVVAFELFTAAHKYEIKGLKECMRKLLSSKPDAWYKVDMLMKFYSFAKSTEGEDDLKLKAVKLIKTIMDTLLYRGCRNYKDVRQTEGYRQLFKDDPAIAMELTDLLLELPH